MEEGILRSLDGLRMPDRFPRGTQ